MSSHTLASYLYSYTHICTYGNAYTTQVQIKTCLASTVQASIPPVYSLAAIEVIWHLEWQLHALFPFGVHGKHYAIIFVIKI